MVAVYGSKRMPPPTFYFTFESSSLGRTHCTCKEGKALCVLSEGVAPVPKTNSSPAAGSGSARGFGSLSPESPSVVCGAAACGAPGLPALGAVLELDIESASTSTAQGCEGPSQACFVVTKLWEMGGGSPVPLPGAPSQCHSSVPGPDVTVQHARLSGAWDGMGEEGCPS